MGLLDALQYSPPPSSGGLLDFLRSLQPQQFPVGLPSDTAQYDAQPQAAQQPIVQQQQNAQPSPLDNAQWPFGPNGAPSQAMAQMPPASPPAVVQAPQAGNPLMAGIQSWANTPGGLLGRLANGAAGFMTGQRTDPVAAEQQKAQLNNNRTLQALQQAGVSGAALQAAASNPEALTTLVKQTFGPQTVQSLGSGYIADKNGKISRAYEPEDKIPAGFAKTDDGKMNYIPGGPADPAYQRLIAAKAADPNGVFVLGKGGELYKKDAEGNVTIVHKNADAEGDPLTDAAVSLAADRAISGDTKALTNLGRGAQGRADLVKINNAIAEKMKDNPNAAKQIQQNIAQQAGLVSSSRALGTKETHFGVAEKAMEESIPLAQAASDAVPRSEWMHLNQLIQAGQREHSNPQYKKFLIANDTAVKDYARTINPTGALRESDIEYARKTLSTADGPEAYKAGLEQLQMEAGVMHRAIQRQKAELQGGAGAPPALTGKTQNGISWGLVR